MMPARILAFSREAGGAAAIAPVLLELKETAELLVLAKDYAKSIFRDTGLSPIPFPEFSDEAVDRMIADHLGAGIPDAVFTSATSLPQLDMTERYLWQWARSREVPSVAVVDQWQNYAVRFSGPGPEEHLNYLPDRIAAMDRHALRAMIDAGLPEGRVVITGQPAFDKLSRIRDDYTCDERKAFRRQISVTPDSRLVCFVSEAFGRDFGARLGYTEQSVSRDLLSICTRLAAESGLPLHLAVKLHPQNCLEEFDWLRRLALPSDLRVTLHWTEQAPIPLVMASDLVVGMSSVLLLESILLGRPTVSYQPATKEKDALIATVLGAIPLIDNPEDCQDIFMNLLKDPSFRTEYLGQQMRLTTDGGAALRVADLVRSVIRSR